MQNFVSFAASIAELAHGKNRVLNQSLNHSPSLYGVAGTEAFASEYGSNTWFMVYCWIQSQTADMAGDMTVCTMCENSLVDTSVRLLL